MSFFKSRVIEQVFKNALCMCFKARLCCLSPALSGFFYVQNNEPNKHFKRARQSNKDWQRQL